MDKTNILERKFIPATCSHESELLHCVVTPAINAAWSTCLINPSMHTKPVFDEPVWTLFAGDHAFF